MREGFGVLLLVVTLLACAQRPAVTVEQVYETKARHSERKTRVFPPRCGDLPTADYPDLAEQDRPAKVDVRIDLTLDEQGRATDLRPTVLDAVDVSEPFVEAALAAASRLRCEPALRLPGLESEELTPMPIAYRSSIVFHFYSDEREAHAD